MVSKAKGGTRGVCLRDMTIKVMRDTACASEPGLISALFSSEDSLLDIGVTRLAYREDCAQGDYQKERLLPLFVKWRKEDAATKSRSVLL